MGMQLKVVRLSANKNSPDQSMLQNMIKFPDNFKGQIIYITETGDELFPPFYNADKFYVNEDGEWFEAPFIEST
jgi:hypothetical protein